jgi:hypothetical protein
MNASFCRAGFQGNTFVQGLLLAGLLAMAPAASRGQEMVITDLSEASPSPLANDEGVFTTEADPSGLIQHYWDRQTQSNYYPRWTASVDALMLWRGNVPSLPIFLDAAGDTAIDSNDVLPGVSAGPRFGLMRQIGCDHAIEGNYFQVTPFTGSQRLPATGGPFEIADVGGIAPFTGDIETGNVSTSGQIRSAELNWRTWNGLSLNWLAGFRWVEWTDSMDIAFVDPFGEGSLRSKTGNNLYGGQIGADARLWNRGGRFKLNAIGKAGVFYNSGVYQRTVAILDGAVINSPSATSDETAFFGEVGLNATTQLTKSIAWRLGYNVFWLSGVATAPQQLAANNVVGDPAVIDTNGSVLLHGVNTGIEARW